MAEQTLPSQAEHLKQWLRAERRAWIRLPSDQEICCQLVTNLAPEEAKTGWLGRVRDVSPGGIALILNRRFQPGTMLMVDLSANAEEGRGLQVRVVYSTPELKGRWIIGCAFGRVLTQAELQTFIRE